MKYKHYKSYLYKGQRIQAYGNSVRELADSMKRKEEQVDRQSLGGNIPFNKWCDLCIERYKVGATDKTIKDMKSALRSRVYPFLEGVPLYAITREDCQLVVSRMVGYSQSYINSVMQAMSFVFRYALIERLISEDPMTNVIPPRGTRKKRRALTAKEREAVIDLAKTKRQYYVFLLMLLCGCRPGEASECMGKDVSEVNGVPTLHIRGQKTAFSDRFVPIPKDLYSLVRNTPKNEYLSPTERGNKQTTDKLRRTWEYFRRKLDISLGAKTYRNKVVSSVLAPDLVPYCFRHEYCTDLARRGIDIRLAQRLMGHANIRMTANIYTNLDTEDIISQTAVLAD